MTYEKTVKKPEIILAENLKSDFRLSGNTETTDYRQAQSTVRRQ